MIEQYKENIKRLEKVKDLMGEVKESNVLWVSDGWGHPTEEYGLINNIEHDANALIGIMQMLVGRYYLKEDE